MHLSKTKALNDNKNLEMNSNNNNTTRLTDKTTREWQNNMTNCKLDVATRNNV